MFRKRRIFDFLSQTEVPCLKENSSIRQAVTIFEEFHLIESIPIVSENNYPRGVIARARLFESLVAGLSLEASASQIMESEFIAVTKDSFLKDTFHEEQQHIGIRHNRNKRAF